MQGTVVCIFIELQILHDDIRYLRCSKPPYGSVCLSRLSNCPPAPAPLLLHPCSCTPPTLTAPAAPLQDGQEFMKLLLMKREAFMAHSSIPGAGTLIPSLFRGTYSYVTTCARCGHGSQGSSRENDFYELPVQVQGMASLHGSLVGGSVHPGGAARPALPARRGRHALCGKCCTGVHGMAVHCCPVSALWAACAGLCWQP
jgi:hypothetical protein